MRLALTTLAAAVVSLAALAVMSAIAGWDDVLDQLDVPRSWEFAAAFLAHVVAFGGYVFAYRGVARIEGGREMSLRRAARLVTVGFAPFIAMGGAAVDQRALGETKHEGEVRVIALDALEHAPLAPAACAAAWALLASGNHKPGLDFTLPWATLVPIGAAVAIWAVPKRDRFLHRAGWRGKLGQILEGIHILFRLAAERREYWPAFVGAAVWWAGDVACLWFSLRPFGATPTLAAIVLAHAVGYVLTRRTLPLAGAGVVEVLMPLTLVAGAPFAGAILGVFVYRIFNLWLPLVPALVLWPKVRDQEL